MRFLQNNKALIAALVQIEKIFKLVCQQLKTQGFVEQEKHILLDKIEQVGTQGQATVFKQKVNEYLQELSRQSQALNQNHLLCSSDIIESYFGKFKAKVNTDSAGQLTEFIFTMATFGAPFSIKESKDALESIKCSDLKTKKTL